MKDSDQITICIEVCKDCEQHLWNTRHKKEKYEQYFSSMVEALTAELGPIDVMRNEIPSAWASLEIYKGRTEPSREPGRAALKPSIGAFEVRCESALIYSKHETRMWPNCKAVAERVKAYLDDKKNGGKDSGKYCSKFVHPSQGGKGKDNTPKKPAKVEKKASPPRPMGDTGKMQKSSPHEEKKVKSIEERPREEEKKKTPMKEKEKEQKKLEKHDEDKKHDTGKKIIKKEEKKAVKEEDEYLQEEFEDTKGEDKKAKAGSQPPAKKKEDHHKDEIHKEDKQHKDEHHKEEHHKEEHHKEEHHKEEHHKEEKKKAEPAIMVQENKPDASAEAKNKPKEEPPKKTEQKKEEKSKEIEEEEIPTDILAIDEVIKNQNKPAGIFFL